MAISYVTRRKVIWQLCMSWAYVRAALGLGSGLQGAPGTGVPGLDRIQGVGVGEMGYGNREE